jgi:putative DNA primase/helicase
MTQTAITPALTELRRYPQWVCFNADKVPFSPRTGKGADCNNPATWSTYEDAHRAVQRRQGWYKGVGFELVKKQGITCIDLDDCVSEGKISEQAQTVINMLNSYTEHSPSNGIHIWAHGTLPDNLNDSDGLHIEIYDHERYITITGKHVEGTPDTIEDRQEQITVLYQQIIEQRRKIRAAKGQRRTDSTAQAAAGDSVYGLAALERECQEVATTAEGARNNRLNVAAFNLGQLIGGHELTRSTVERELYQAALRSGLPETEIERTMRSGIEDGIQEPRSRSANDPVSGGQGGGNNHGTTSSNRPDPNAQFVINCLHEGEYGDARLFSYLFRGLRLFDHTAKEWYTWSGHYWEVDDFDTIKHDVSGKLASVYLKAGADLNLQASQRERNAEISGNEQEKEQAAEYVTKVKGLIKELSARAFALRQIARCKNVLNFASSFDGMGIIAPWWDRNPWLLAVPNGVIDLKMGQLRPGQPEDYIRTVCPTEWQGLTAPARRFEQYLQEIFEDRPEDERGELIAYLQRLFGYGITGLVTEHKFVVLYGEDGRNGKDTFQRCLSHALGAVSSAIQKDVLLEAGRTRSAGAPTPHLSDLQGKRLAWANEPEKGARFNVGQIKDLSGGGEIPTRGLHEKKITKIQPSHLLILLTNHKPHADANDAAFWDRLCLITFNIRFVDNPIEPNERKKDTTLWVKLEEEAPGILAWLVRGSLEWQQQGLNTPQSVLQAGENYRKEEDTLRLFLEECCIISADKQVKAQALYEAYQTWARSGNLHVMTKTAFGLQLGKKKFTKVKGMYGIFYHGLGLLDTGHEGSMNSLSEPFMGHKSSLEAEGKGVQEDAHEQYEQFQQVFPKNQIRESQKIEKPVESIHTVHGSVVKEPIDRPIEPSQGSMNSSANPSSTKNTGPDGDYEELEL